MYVSTGHLRDSDARQRVRGPPELGTAVAQASDVMSERSQGTGRGRAGLDAARAGLLIVRPLLRRCIAQMSRGGRHTSLRKRPTGASCPCLALVATRHQTEGTAHLRDSGDRQMLLCRYHCRHAGRVGRYEVFGVAKRRGESGASPCQFVSSAVAACWGAGAAKVSWSASNFGPCRCATPNQRVPASHRGQ